MNQTHKPFDNPKIREAIAYAVNKQALIDTFYGGQAVAGRQLDAARHGQYAKADQPADLRPREGQGADRRVRRDRT